MRTPNKFVRKIDDLMYRYLFYDNKTKKLSFIVCVFLWGIFTIPLLSYLTQHFSTQHGVILFTITVGVLSGIVSIVVGFLNKVINGNKDQICPYCGKINKGAIFCNNCARAIEIEKFLLRCPKCGRYFNKETNSCFECGYTFFIPQKHEDISEHK